jgi:hypothetical protein
LDVKVIEENVELVFGCSYKDDLSFVHLKLSLIAPTWIEYPNTENLYSGW